MNVYAMMGKGGVGKSTLAVELGKLLNEMEKCVVIGVDRQHNHKDIIKMEGYNLPFECVDNKITDVIKFVLENTVLKGFSENVKYIASDYVAILNLAELYSRIKDKFDSCVIDFPPNHSGLFMLHYADVLDNMVYKAMMLKERIKRMMKGKSEVLDNIEYLCKICDDLKEIIFKTKFFAVSIPSELSLIETEKLIKELKSLNLNCEAIIVNMVWPIPEAECEMCMNTYYDHNIKLAKFGKLAEQENLKWFQIPFTYEIVEIDQPLNENIVEI